MNEQRRNGYEDEDMKSIVDQIEAKQDEIKKIMSAAAGEVGGVKKRIKVIKDEAKELNIPLKPLNALLKQRKLERQLLANAETVDDDFVEVFVNMTGQYSFFSPDNKNEGPTPGQLAAQKRSEAHDAQVAQETAEGEAVLNGLSLVQ